MRSVLNLAALSAGWVAALGVALLVVAPTVGRPADTTEPVAAVWLTGPTGERVQDLRLELPKWDVSPEEDDPRWDCRVDGNQICGDSATIRDGYGNQVAVSPGYYGEHCGAEPYNQGAREFLGLTPSECE